MPAALCLPIPKGMENAIKAAALPETFFTVWRNLFDVGNLKRGESVLIHGGASGIGTVAIQMAKAFGAQSLHDGGDGRKVQGLPQARRFAGHLNHRTQDFVDEVMKATKGAEVDLALDMVGGHYRCATCGRSPPSGGMSASR